MIRRAYSDDNIRAIFGGNFKRVLGEIWSAVPPAEEPSDLQQRPPGPSPRRSNETAARNGPLTSEAAL